MTATPKTLTAALLAGVLALAGLSGCSSPSQPSATSSKPPSVSRWTDTLNKQMAAADKVCITPNTPDCLNNVEAVMVVLGDIRKEVGTGSAAPRYAGLVAALDQADTDHQTFRDKNCGSDGNQMNCMMLVSRISQDITNVLGALGDL